jgi:hypothetical protein
MEAYMRRVFFICLLVNIVFSTNVFAQQMDAKLNMAKRSLDTLETKLSVIRQGDVAEYNRLSKQLNKAMGLLQSTESKAHPDYVTSIQRWSALRQVMAEKAQQWQAQASQLTAENTTDSEIPTSNSKVLPVQESAVDVDAILTKYHPDSRPKLGNYPNPSEVGEWALKIRALQTTELKNDLAIIEKANANPSDKNRVIRWISGEFQKQIQQQVLSRLQGFNNLIDTAVQLSAQINGIDINDKMRAYNFANDANGRNNHQTLENGLIATANVQQLEEVYPKLVDKNRTKKLTAIVMAQQKLDTMRSESIETGKALAALPKKQKAKKESFLKGIDQELWLNGRILAYLDKKGSIYMDSADVGDITGNGTIWVRGNDLGSIETNGKVWFRGRHIGTLEDNGKVWRNGSQVGTVETNGKVWINGNSNGEIVPFDDEWKRAAVVYYFRDIFAE